MTPASASTPSSSTATYLTAARTATSSRADLRAHLARGFGDAPASRPRISCATRSLPAAGAPRSRRWEKKRSGSQIVHRPHACTSATPAASQPRAGDGLEVGVRPPRGEHGADLVADLIAAGPRRARSPRPPAPRARAPATPASRTPPASPRQPACSIATPLGRRQRDRHAVGRRARSRATPARVAPAVGLLATLAVGDDARPRAPGGPARGAPAPACARSARAVGRHARRGRRRSAARGSARRTGPRETPPRRVVKSAVAPGRPIARCPPAARKLT